MHALKPVLVKSDPDTSSQIHMPGCLKLVQERLGGGNLAKARLI